MKEHSWETSHTMTAQKALAFLKEGNKRFLDNLRMNRNLLQLMNQTADRQFPFAAILSCSDSRVPVELIFDQGLGDIFSIRLAGNIASTNAIGSMEYACKVLDSKLLLVMGHTSCGAVQGACDNLEFGNLTPLLEHIRESLEPGQGNPRDPAFVNAVAKKNVFHSINIIINQSSIIRELLELQHIDIVGAMYDVKTGIVEFFDTVHKKFNYEKQDVVTG